MGSLAQVLRELPTIDDPRLLIPPTGFDDAGVYHISDDQALVQTVDFFPPLVDDPATFGRIAAANSLSDVYAMGGTPLTCLNIVGFPDKDLDIQVLVDILRGGAEKVFEAHAVIVGGHSVRDVEIKYGLSVTGTVHPERVVRNAGARPGDVLVLTKPIGSGVLTTAAKKGTLAAGDLEEAITVMSTLNHGACSAMMAVGPNAATDITGFGLVGHAYEMAEGSGVTIEIEAGSVPLMNHTLELARQGIVTRAAGSNREYLGAALRVKDVEGTLVDILADAQTSGGLLISVAADRADDLLAGLRAHDTPCAMVIGHVQAPSDQRICLV